MILPLGHAIQLHRERYADCKTRCNAKDQAQAQAVTKPEQNRIGDGARQQPQWAMLAAQQVIGEIQAAEHIQTTARDADRCNRMVIHPTIVEAFERSLPTLNSCRLDDVNFVLTRYRSRVISNLR